MRAQCHSSVQTVYPFDKPSPFSVVFLFLSLLFSYCVCVCVFVSFESASWRNDMFGARLCLCLLELMDRETWGGKEKGPGGCVMAAPDKNTELIASDAADACLFLLVLSVVCGPFFLFFFLEKTSTPICVCVALSFSTVTSPVSVVFCLLIDLISFEHLNPSLTLSDRQYSFSSLNGQISSAENVRLPVKNNPPSPARLAFIDVH